MPAVGPRVDRDLGAGGIGQGIPEGDLLAVVGRALPDDLAGRRPVDDDPDVALGGERLELAVAVEVGEPEAVEWSRLSGNRSNRSQTLRPEASRARWLTTTSSTPSPSRSIGYR